MNPVRCSPSCMKILVIGSGGRGHALGWKFAQFESSKAFSQRFMEQHGIPTARSGIFDEPAAARQFAASLDGRCAVKADGLALGKGVLICMSVAEADHAIADLLVSKTFGAAG